MNHPPNNTIVPNRRGGFTLVEMLVATALVVLIMLLFASIFGVAVGTMSEQRGMANNDSKARIVESTLRGDLEKMTFRQPVRGGVKGIVPLAPGDVPDANQRGYFYYSENDPHDPTDDVLQFTVDVRNMHRSDSNVPLLGKAVNLPVNTANEPEMDDGIQGNFTTISRAAEVQYFVRNGNLYRRVFLLRDQRLAPRNIDLNDSSSIDANEVNIQYETQPTVTTVNPPVRIFGDNTTSPPQGLNPNYTVNPSFYNDFDMSVTRVPIAPASAGQPWRGMLHFNGIGSLENGTLQTDPPIALPYMRSGFAPYNPVEQNPIPSAGGGRPLEFSRRDVSAGGAYFIGRFTQEETSHSGFTYPGQAANNLWSNPQAVLQDTDGDGVPDNFTGGPRSGEDLLLVGVEGFDVKIWDPTYTELFTPPGGGTTTFDANGNGTPDLNGLFVDIGHNYGLDVGGGVILPAGRYSIWSNANPNYGPFVIPPGGQANIPVIMNGIPSAQVPASPATAQWNWNRVYDTWHPDFTFWVIDANGDGIQNTGEVNRNPPYRPLLHAATTANTTWGTTPAARVRSPGQVFFPPNSNGSIGFRVIRSGEAVLNAQGAVISYADFNSNGTIDPGISNLTQPEWPLEVGAIVTENAHTPSLADDVVWQAFDNRIGLEMIQITTRYRDPSSGLSRQVTIQHSFVE